MIRQFLSRQFIVFLITGGTAALLNFGSRILFNIWFGFSLSVVLAYLIGMITAFFLARIFVFKTGEQALGKSMIFFALVNVVAIAQTWGISVGLVYYIFPVLGVTTFAPELAHGIGVAVPVFTSYIGHKKWSFK